MREGPTAAPKGWLLYDGACGFCGKWVACWEPLLKRHGFGIAPLQDTWVRSRLQMVKGELLQDVRLLFVDGRVICGPQVYREMMKRIWWSWPVYALSCLPGLRQVFDGAYRVFARNRHRVSAACPLGGSSAKGSSVDRP
jgi:predicted DCC family thiol-disulfide oxidoreductase YuxK